MTRERAILAILASNAATLIAAMVFGWGMLHLMWPFWIQSVIIGVFSFRRIASLQDFDVGKLKINGLPVENTQAVKQMAAGFFALHYGIFHFVYFSFLVGMSFSAGSGTLEVIESGSGHAYQVEVGAIVWLDWPLFAALGYSFWQSHSLSHRENIEADQSGKPSLTMMMFLPYARILPMHLTLVLGVFAGILFGSSWVIILMFMLLKTAADLLIHVLEHRYLRRHAEQESR